MFSPPADAAGFGHPGGDEISRGAARHASMTGLVDAFEQGRRDRAVGEAAEVRVLAHAAALVSVPAGASPEQIRRCELDRRALVADFATSTRVSEWTVTRLMGEAADLVERFEPFVAALGRGEISRQHVAVMHDAGRLITDDGERAVYIAAAVQRARVLTPGALAPVARILAERHLDRPLQERHDDAARRRSVSITDQPDGMACLNAFLPATLAHGIHDRITQQARALIDARTEADTAAAARDPRDDGDGTASDADSADEPRDARTLEQVRADIFTDTLLTSTGAALRDEHPIAAIRATVHLTIPVLTLVGAGDEPCLLAGYGPIDPATARDLAGDTDVWDRVLTSPVTGDVLAVERYRPGAALQRFLRARDEQCRFPGCRAAAHRCDLDHTRDAAHGGPTCHDNLAHLCRRHHTMKHHTRWTVEQATPGVLVWVSPTGRRHTDHPEPTVRFTPDPDILTRRRVMRDPWLLPPDPADPPPY